MTILRKLVRRAFATLFSNVVERLEREQENKYNGEEDRQKDRAVRAAGREVRKIAAARVETDEEDVIEEEEEEEESAAQKKKREKKERADKLAAFVAKYVEENNIENGYQWNGHKRQQLTGALIAAGVGDTEDTTVAAIRKYLKSRPPPPAPAAPPAAAPAPGDEPVVAPLFADPDIEPVAPASQ
jgi:hypothetical protein